MQKRISLYSSFLQKTEYAQYNLELKLFFLNILIYNIIYWILYPAFSPKGTQGGFQMSFPAAIHFLYR